MKREKILIPKPIANKGDKVMVLNYRRKDVWEEGIVTGLEYRNSWGDFDWTYDVILLRPSKVGNKVRLYVGDDKIKRCSKK